MKNLIPIFLSLLSITSSFAQKQGPELIDSLKSRFKTSLNDTSKVRLLGKLSFQYYQFDTDSGIHYAEQAIVLSEKINWGLGVAFSYNYLGTNYAVKGNYPKALEYFTRSLSKYTEIGDKQGVAFLLNNLGNFYRILKNYPKAIEFTNKAIAINTELRNKKDLVKNYNNLGCIYTDLSDFSKSDDAYNLGLRISEEINNKELSMLILVNIADNRMKTKNYCGALELCIKAIKISEALNIPYDLAAYNSYIGEIYLKIANDSSNVANDCPYYSKDKHKNLIHAKEYLLIALHLLDNINDQAMISSSAALLSGVYEKLGDPENALLFYKKYSTNKDSVFSKDNSIQIANIEKKREVELKDKQIEIQTLAIDKKNSQIIFQIILFILFLLFTILIFYLLYKKKSNKVLRESEERFRALYEDAPVGLYRTKTDGKIILANRALCNILGYSSFEELSTGNLEQTGFGSLYPRKQFTEQIEKYGEVKDFETKLIRYDGHAIIVKKHVKVIRDSKGNIQYYDGTVEDITERKRAEVAMKEALVKAESGDRLKTAFMNNISHEIRTPLNGILGFTRLIIEPDISNEEKEQFHLLIKASSNRLLNTVTNYMDISLIASGNIDVKLKSIDLHKLLHLLYDQFQPLCDNKNLLMRLEISDKTKKITLHSDTELFQKILSHLLDNAVKFTNQGEITFGYTILTGAIEFYVKDTGIGISHESVTLIFESFKQEELSPTRGHEGSGLGLSIAQGLVRLLGGEMRVDSIKGSGSTFFFTVPYEEMKKEDVMSEDVNMEVTVHDNPVVLIAEDDESNFQFLKAVLKKSTITVLSANNGKEAVSRCREHPEISLVLMDLKMPVMDGFEATQAIRSFRKDLPIIALTAFAMSGDEKRALEAGCDYYLSKPVSREVLLDKLKKYGLAV